MMFLKNLFIVKLVELNWIYRNTAQPNTSKAVVELEVSGKETLDAIKNKITQYLEEKNALGSVPATSDDFVIKDFEGNI